jgi:transcriptional regulator with XRE-family HTH domain
LSTADFVERLRAEMKRQGLSVQELASRLGCTPPNVRQILAPGTSMRISTAERLAGALGFVLELRLVSTAAAAAKPTLGSDSKSEVASAAARPRGAAPGRPERRRRPPSWRPL